MAEVLLYVNEVVSSGAWTPVGTTPYLSAQDQPTNYVHSASRNANSDVMGFENSADLGTINFVRLYIYAVYGKATTDFTTFINATDTGLGPPAAWGWVYVDVSAILTSWAAINAATMYLDKPNTANDPGVDCAYLLVDYSEAGITGTIAGEVGEITGAASGTVALAGGVAAALAPVAAVVSGTVAIAGDIAAGLTAITAVAEGTVADAGGIAGDITAFLAPMTGVVEGTVAVAGAIAAEVAAVTAVVAAAVPIGGDITAILAQLAGSVGGSVLVSGDIDGTLAAIVAQLSASLEQEGTKQTDGNKVKAYLIDAGFNEEEINVLPWTIPDEIIESVVILYDHSLEEYKQSGLG